MQTFSEAGIEVYWVDKSNKSGRIDQRRADRQRIMLKRQALRQAVGKEAGRQ